ncbi:MAG: bacillithiol system redox-active protein YtxJ [Candidatus Cohnella colombiensis]|uniref:Bacillithiol system redox-active protein YtxJ n=1 Tax=Candidatus Cohnella colombiensis TaxID=3121368 RepID=A0AA95ETB8_9BACL|nr:MAG: bacillithiol system redox-active protein YtxJ [Cohnella sp.]
MHRNNMSISRLWQRGHIRYLPAILWMCVIFYSSSRSGDELDSVLPWVQKFLPGLSDFNPMHLVAYFVLALTIAYALGKRAATWQGFLVAIAICVIYGLTDEWHQSFVPRRTPDVHDILNDTIGAALGSGVVWYIHRMVNERRRKILQLGVLKMANMKQLMTIEQWHEVLKNSSTKPLLVYKHSTSCSVSAGAQDEVMNYVSDVVRDGKQAPVDFAIVHVIEERPVSNQIAEDLGVKHASPQAILVQDGKAVWDTSHWHITYAFLSDKLGNPSQS